MTRGAWPLTLTTSQQRKLAPICCTLGCDKCVIGSRINTSMVYLQMRLGQLLQLHAWLMNSGRH